MDYMTDVKKIYGKEIVEKVRADYESGKFSIDQLKAKYGKGISIPSVLYNDPAYTARKGKKPRVKKTDRITSAELEECIFRGGNSGALPNPDRRPVWLTLASWSSGIGPEGYPFTDEEDLVLAKIICRFHRSKPEYYVQTNLAGDLLDVIGQKRPPRGGFVGVSENTFRLYAAYLRDEDSSKCKLAEQNRTKSGKGMRLTSLEVGR